MKKKFSRDRLKAEKEAGAERCAAKASALAVFFGEEDELEPAPDENEDIAGGQEAAYAAAPDGGGLISFTVRPEEAGRRLDLVLAARRPDYSRSQLARLAREGQVLVEGRPVKASAVLAAGQTVACPAPEAPPTDLRPEPEVRLKIIYEDRDILVINKDWGLAVHPAPGYGGPTVAGGLLARDLALSEVGERHRPGLVHRLDKDTSGVLISARNEAALHRLAEAFSQRETLKRYLAFVRGRPKEGQGVVDSPIGRHPTQRHKMAAGVAGGRPARTFWRLLKHFPESGISLMLLTLVTGRTHQARVHLQSLGLPVLADPVYSRGAADLLKTFPELEPYLQRQLLHARRLSLAHPANGRPMTFHAPWPDDFLGLFLALSRKTG